MRLILYPFLFVLFVLSFSGVGVRPEKKKRKTRGDHFKQRFRKNFTTLLEEEVGLSSSPGVFNVFRPMSLKPMARCSRDALFYHRPPSFTFELRPL